MKMDFVATPALPEDIHYVMSPEIPLSYRYILQNSTTLTNEVQEQKTCIVQYICNISKQDKMHIFGVFISCVTFSVSFSLTHYIQYSKVML